MAVSTKDQTVTIYKHKSMPPTGDNVPVYLENELRRLEQTLQDLSDGMPQVSAAAPDLPRNGMIRKCVAPWDPLNRGTSAYWVQYNGSAWVSFP